MGHSIGLCGAKNGMLAKQRAAAIASRMERLAMIKERHQKLFVGVGSEMEEAFIESFDDDESGEAVEDVVVHDDDLVYESN